MQKRIGESVPVKCFFDTRLRLIRSFIVRSTVRSWRNSAPALSGRPEAVTLDQPLLVVQFCPLRQLVKSWHSSAEDSKFKAFPRRADQMRQRSYWTAITHRLCSADSPKKFEGMVGRFSRTKYMMLIYERTSTLQILDPSQSCVTRGNG